MGPGRDQRGVGRGIGTVGITAAAGLRSVATGRPSRGEAERCMVGSRGGLGRRTGEPAAAGRGQTFPKNRCAVFRSSTGISVCFPDSCQQSLERRGLRGTLLPRRSRMEPIERTVANAELGLRLDQFLARQPEVGTRARAKELIEQGRVELSEGRPKAGLQLFPGQVVQFRPLPMPPADRLAGDGTPPPAVPVLFADDWIVVIDKPAGLASHPPEDRAFAGHTVASVMRAQFGPLPTLGGEDRPGIVHRLDRDTSGVMLLARTEAAFHALRAQWQARSVQKEYRCVAFGESRFDSDWIERPIAPDPMHPDRMV